jgi:hypothetical protein
VNQGQREIRHDGTVPAAADIPARPSGSGVRVNFVGNEDHLRAGAGQAAGV